MKLELTREELNNCKDGSLVGMACRNCEGHEVHRKGKDGWVCEWCGTKTNN